MTMIICGKDCMDCAHLTSIDDENPRRIKVYCSIKEKKYWFGQSIQCEKKERIKNGGKK